MMKKLAKLTAHNEPIESEVQYVTVERIVEVPAVRPSTCEASTCTDGDDIHALEEHGQTWEPLPASSYEFACQAKPTDITRDVSFAMHEQETMTETVPLLAIVC